MNANASSQDPASPTSPSNLSRDGALVTMDHRESPSGMKEFLEQHPGVRVTVDTLTDGDYSVDGTLLVERKTAADFAASILDTRLFRQASRAGKTGCPVIYIIEGTGRDFSATGIKREALQGALITLSLIFRIPVLRAIDQKETAKLMLYAAGQLRRASGGLAPLNHRKPKTVRKQKVRLLRTLPGIGPDRAERLLEKFGSVEKCLSASAEELAAIEGIGEKTAERIRRIVEEHAEPYG